MAITVFKKRSDPRSTISDPYAALERLGAALNAGDRDAVLACFAPDATVGVLSGGKRLTFTGRQIGDAVDAVLAGFGALRLKPISRLVAEAGLEQDSVMSGDHHGIFAGAEPTSRRVFVNLQLTAVAGPDSSLESLSITADTRALFVQIAGTDDVDAVGGVLIATARERQDNVVRMIDKSLPAWVPSIFSDPDRPTASRRRRVAALAVAVVLLGAGVTWRAASATENPKAHSAVAGASGSAGAKHPTKAPPAKPAAKAPARPVIAKADPKAVPHVQAGKQVVLKSDVLFAFDSSALTPAATTALNRLAQQVRKARVTGTIQINGYTDNLGAADYGIALSRARALAVAKVLQRALVGRPVTLVPQGFGHANPVAPNTSDAGRTRNRRVTVVLPHPR